MSTAQNDYADEYPDVTIVPTPAGAFQIVVKWTGSAYRAVVWSSGHGSQRTKAADTLGVTRAAARTAAEDHVARLVADIKVGLRASLPERHEAKYGGERYAGIGRQHRGTKDRHCHGCGLPVGPSDQTCNTCRAYVCLKCASCMCDHSRRLY